MSGQHRIISGEIAQSKVKGKGLVKALGAMNQVKYISKKKKKV